MSELKSFGKRIFGNRKHHENKQATSSAATPPSITQHSPQLITTQNKPTAALAPRPPSRSSTRSVSSGAKSDEKDTQNPQVRNLWQEAQEQLSEEQKAILNLPEKDELPKPSDHDSATNILDAVIERTEEEYKDYNLRGWHSKKGDKTRETNIRIQAKDILCSALQFRDLVDGVLKFDPSGYGMIVWTVISGGLKLLQNDKDRLEAVFDSAAILARLLPKYAIVEAQYLDWKTDQQQTFEDCIVKVYAALLKFSAEVSKELGLNLGKRLVASVHTIDAQTITILKKDVIAKDSEATDLLALVGHQYRRKEFAKLDKKADKTLASTELVVQKLQENEKAETLGWLSDVPYSERHIELQRDVMKNSPDSGQWFLKSPEFQDWKRNPHTFLWMNGVSGCGKSSLCSTIVEHVASSFRQDDTKILAYWYFDNRSSATQDLRLCLRSILRQISAPADPFASPVRDLAKHHKLSKSDPLLPELVKTLRDTITQLHEHVFIVIDALDECPLSGKGETREDLLDILRQLVEPQLPKLHLLVTSIREIDIIAEIRSFSAAIVEVDIETRILVDVDTYLQLNLDKLGQKKKWVTPEMKYKIKQALEVREQKRFRMTALQFEDLFECFDEPAIDITLQSNPKTEEDKYKQKLAAIWEKRQQDVGRVQKIFYWLSNAFEPLTLAQIAASPGVTLPDPTDILTLCSSSLIMITKQNREDQTIEVVQFAHASVKRFLQSPKLKESGHEHLSRFFIDDTHGHHELTSSCLSYLLQASDPKLPSANSLINTSKPLLVYAGRYWYKHFKASGDEETSVPGIIDLFNSQACFLNWMRVANPESRKSILQMSFEQSPSPLYIALHLELFSLAEQMMKDGVDFESSGGKEGTPLELSVTRGYTTVIQQLLDLGAKSGKALHTAVSQGATDIVQKLLDADPESVSQKDDEFGNILQMASYHGYKDIAKVLIDKKANVNALGGLFGTALQAAATSGQEGIVAMLLDKRADPNTTSGLLGNALQAALTGKHYGIVDQLANSGAEYDTEGGCIWEQAHLELLKERPDDTLRFRDSSLLFFAKQKNFENQPFVGGPIGQSKMARVKGDQSLLAVIIRHRGAIDSVPGVVGGLHTRGFLYESLFWLSVFMISSFQKRSRQSPSMKSKKDLDYMTVLKEVVETVMRRGEDQRLLEARRGKLLKENRTYPMDQYDEATVRLVGLYKTACGILMDIVTILNFGQQSIFRLILKKSVLKGSLKDDSALVRDLQALLQQENMFVAAMARSQATQAHDDRMMGELRQYSGSINALTDRVQYLEQKLTVLLHEELPAIIQSEVSRQVKAVLEESSSN